MTPDDPVPALPVLRPRQRVIVVDAKHRAQLRRWDGRTGQIYGHRSEHGVPLRFWPDGDHRTIPIDSPRCPGSPDALIVEPLDDEPPPGR